MGRLLLFAIILLGLCGCSVAQPPAAAPTPAVKEVTNVLKTLRQGHPRLICTNEDLARIKDTLARDETAKSYFESIRAEADKNSFPQIPAFPVIKRQRVRNFL